MQKIQDITIREVMSMYFTDRAIYFDNGNGPTRYLQNIKSGLKPVLEEMGSAKLKDLDAPTLAGLRDQWVQEGRIARSTINRRLQFVTKLIKWCIERGYSTPEQLIGISTVERIKRGRYGARDTEPVGPACPDAVRLVMQEVPESIRAMMELIELTGMRPGEARRMKLSELERVKHNGESVFKYTPSRHKTSHLGKRRRIFIAGRARQIIIERISTLAKSTLFEEDSEGYLFSPDGDGAKPYQESSVPQAIRRARKRAGVDRWTPNQLRHTYATETRSKGYQLELIADLLGHADPRTTLIYAEPDDGAALDAAVKLAG